MQATPHLLNRAQAAAFLGVALRTLDTLTAKGEIPVVSIGRSRRFRASSLEYFVEANESRPPVRKNRRNK